MTAEEQSQAPRPTPQDIQQQRLRTLQHLTGRIQEHRANRDKGENWEFFIKQDGKKIGQVGITSEMINSWEGIARRLASRIPPTSSYHTEAQETLGKLDQDRRDARNADIQRLNRMWDAGAEEE